MQYENIIYEKRDQVATITLNRPQSLNALDPAMGQELVDCLIRCSEDADCRALILTGAGRAFCAGGDVKDMRASMEDSPQLLLKRLTIQFHTIVSDIRRMNKPVIAAVKGVASGAGFPLALACDLVIAAEGTRFNAAYVLIGLSPDGGLTYFLPRLVGLQRASQLFFSGDVVDAERGLEMGFVNQVVKEEELMEVAYALASRLASAPTLAIAEAKQLINCSLSESLESQLENERQAIARSAGTEDFKEGISAFFEKRKASFKGC
ncbi:MAG: enoyl-CoA hydratase/isomerase family protein [Dehalococcoidia bacterium]